jgi:hypothetical protein
MNDRRKLLSLLRRCARVRIDGGARLDEGEGDLPTELREVLADAAVAQRQLPGRAQGKRTLPKGWQTRTPR